MAEPFINTEGAVAALRAWSCDAEVIELCDSHEQLRILVAELEDIGAVKDEQHAAMIAVARRLLGDWYPDDAGNRWCNLRTEIDDPLVFEPMTDVERQTLDALEADDG
jgi:hypothetical protein